MSYAAAQARHDAMIPDDADADIYESDIDTLREALGYIDCDETNGRKYWDCIRRSKLTRARIAELEQEQETEEQEAA